MFDFKKIEEKWRKKWGEGDLYRAEDFGKKPKYYILEEFPYCSGEGLHIGHAFTNIIGDVLARQKRMNGFNVLHPMGWDAFGLPTENSAIKTGIQPAVITARNTKRFHEQNNRLGISYDWSREIDTSDPDYYKWTQWLFLQFFKHGLAYKTETPVGWCPSCKIILANEEIVGGKCERCGHEAERREQKQWLLKITAYADRLADELDLVDYPDYVKKSQRDWIGKSQGVIIDYPLVGEKGSLSCYSTRPDTNFGATFIVVAPEHPFVTSLLNSEFQVPSSKKEEIKKYLEEARKKSELERTELEKEKTGVFTGLYCLNRLSGRKIPVYISDFVVLTAGTGMVVGVPAHDKRDWEFAKKYHLEIIPVIKPKNPSAGGWDYDKEPFLDIDDAEVFNSDFLNGLPALEAKEKIIDYLVKKDWGKRAVNYHLRDWIFSRQHYWGEPIPIVHCQKCGMVPVSESELPVRLPEVEKYQPTDTGESPLANIADWVNTTCPKCGGPAKRETDTMPNWAGSSWYYIAYCFASKLKTESLKLKTQNIFENSKDVLDYWLPVDLYLGGAEHTTLHLLYSRFWHKFLNDIGLVPGKEPYAARRQHGVILGEDGSRMSKSRGNVVNPDEMVDKFGADTLRLYLMFMGPYDSNAMPWSSKGLEGCWRFVNRVWNICLDDKKVGQKTSEELANKLQKLIKKVTQDVETLKHNTAIAALMEFLNDWSSQGVLSSKDTRTYIQLLAPLAPFMAEELWQKLDGKDSIHASVWPKPDPKYLIEEEVEIPIQVNGKVRSKLRIKSEELRVEEKIIEKAKQDQKVADYLKGKKIIKTIFVPGRLVNFVVK